MKSSHFTKFATVVTDERITPFIGYCPYCPLHEGIRTHVQLKDVTRECRQCPNCLRVYFVADSKSGALRRG